VGGGSSGSVARRKVELVDPVLMFECHLPRLLLILCAFLQTLEMIYQTHHYCHFSENREPGAARSITYKLSGEAFKFVNEQFRRFGKAGFLCEELGIADLDKIILAVCALPFLLVV
jgi:hypothetical protein